MKTTNRYFAVIYSLFALMFLLACASAFAAGFPKAVTITWKLPITNTDGTAIDSSSPLTKVQVFLANASIPDNSTAAPTVELGPAVVTTNQTFTVFAGGKLFVRVKACNANSCSDFSAQSSVDIPNSTPGVPTEVTITLVPG